LTREAEALAIFLVLYRHFPLRSGSSNVSVRCSGPHAVKLVYLVVGKEWWNNTSPPLLSSKQVCQLRRMRCDEVDDLLGEQGGRWREGENGGSLWWNLSVWCSQSGLILVLMVYTQDHTSFPQQAVETITQELQIIVEEQLSGC